MTGDTGTKYLRATVAGIGGQRIPRRLQEKWIDGISRQADDVVGAAGEQGSTVRTWLRFARLDVR
jgi:hypothetical protein